MSMNDPRWAGYDAWRMSLGEPDDCEHKEVPISSYILKYDFLEYEDYEDDEYCYFCGLKCPQMVEIGLKFYDFKNYFGIVCEKCAEENTF